jgi:hypothetical protein
MAGLSSLTGQQIFLHTAWVARKDVFGWEMCRTHSRIFPGVSWIHGVR